MTVGIFTSSAKSVMGLTFSDTLTLVSKVRFKVSSVHPFKRSWHTVAMYMNGPAPGSGVGGSPPLVGVLGVRMQYNTICGLVKSYIAAALPESMYELELDGDTTLKMEADARKISESPYLPTARRLTAPFAELIELGLMLQNLFDDVASILERLQAALSFQDVVASWLFIAGCCLLFGAVALLGWRTFVFLVLLWQVRPPALRDALPPPPLSYFLKLPCKSAAEFG
ncbi:hypothetical protein TSOC_009358 [Tetrabaena socialis]|uniref:Multiple C2 domain-containing protein n=1 Tax=Tetrabaena socialis TaxID=47790 RepID=A0A2J7ZW08_9CHLO|nr:hypothetical protein TSOC_009358 [Tetrabaena socialis]|eukprot:PNH04471.1 hypothetical protein TSOC_009358 [Tetrabaena socialis]